MECFSIFTMTKYYRSKEGLPTNLHIWDPMPTNTAIMETKTIDFYPLSSIESSDAISFVIPAMQKYMLDKVEILTDIKVVNANGTNPAADNNVSTVPHLAAALWRNVKCSIGGVSLTQSFDNAYTMFKFWETVIHNPEALHPLLKLKEGLLLDSVSTKAASESVVFYPAGGAELVNSHGKHRANRIAQGTTLSLISDLNVSLFKQEKLLPHSLEIQLNLTKNYDEFILLSAAAATEKVVFEKVILRCTFQRPTDMILNLLEERLSRENAIYHADKSVLSFHSISQGAQEVTVDLFNGVLPYCFLIGVQDRTAFGRHRNKNAFSLHPINKVQLFVSGQELFPRPIERSTSEYGIMYDTLLKQTGYINRGDTLLHNHYKAYPAMAFDLTPNKNQNQHSLNLVKHGTVRLTFELNNAADNYVLMILSWYEQIIEITKNRELILV